MNKCGLFVVRVYTRDVWLNLYSHHSSHSKMVLLITWPEVRGKQKPIYFFFLNTKIYFCSIISTFLIQRTIHYHYKTVQHDNIFWKSMSFLGEFLDSFDRFFSYFPLLFFILFLCRFNWLNVWWNGNHLYHSNLASFLLVDIWVHLFVVCWRLDIW